MPTIICTVTNDLSQDQRMIRICSSLQAAGYEVMLVGRKRRQSLPLVERSFQQHRINCHFEAGKLFYLEFNLRLLKYLWQHPASIINSVDLDTLLPGYLVSRLRSKTQCVYDAHEYFTEVPEVTRRPLVQRIWSALANWVIPQLKYAYTVGPALARIFGERYGTPFTVVRNVPVRRPAPDRNEVQEGMLLYQGMLNEGRGLEVAIKAMKLLPAYFQLTLVGSGDVENELKALTAQEGLTDRVHFTGFIQPDELPKYTRQAWLGLNLLENTGLSYYYSLANKAFDYIQSHCPSVQMAFPEYAALQEEYGCFMLLEALEPSALAQLILGVANDPAAYRTLVARNAEAAEQLCWENEERELFHLYQQVLKEH